MSVELLYTSSELGLKQGSRGFCTVISTAGMPINLANRLESLSGYRHIFQPGTAEAAQNPIAFSHLRLSVGGRVVSILSRVADYGLDYSQRTNKIAHHLVLDPTEFASAGPAWVMRQRGVFRELWDGKCSTPNVGPSIPLGDKIPAVCTEWHSVTGDAGWAGVLAENLSRRSDKPFWIIFSVEQSNSLLALMDEAIALLPAKQRWEATFSTYTTTVPPDIDCRVRCVLQGSNEARLAPARGQVIDLTKPLPLTLVHAFISLAREGRAVTSPTAIPNISRNHNQTEFSKASSTGKPQEETGKLISNLEQSWQTELRLQNDLQLQPIESKPVTPPRPPAIPEAKTAGRSGQNRATRNAVLALVCSALLLVIASTFTWYAMSGNTASTSTATASNAEVDSPARAPDTDNSITGSVSNEPSEDSVQSGDPSQATEHANAQEPAQTTNVSNNEPTASNEPSTGSINAPDGEKQSADVATRTADEDNGKSEQRSGANENKNPTETNVTEQKESSEVESRSAGENTGTIASAKDSPNPKEGNAPEDVDTDISMASQAKLKYSYADREFAAYPKNPLNLEEYLRGNFRLMASLEMNAPIGKLYCKVKNGSHQNIEKNPVLIDEKSGVPILNGRYTLRRAEFLNDENKINLEVEVDINDNSLEELHDKLKSLIKKYNKDVVTWPTIKDFPKRLNQNQLAKFLASLDLLKTNIEAMRPKNDNPNQENTSGTQTPDQGPLPPLLEEPLEIVNDFLKLKNKFIAHRNEFANRLNTQEPLDFSGLIFLNANPSDAASWEPLEIRLKPKLPVSF